MSEPAVIDATAARPEQAAGEPEDLGAGDALLVEELLVEEVSIDGMCGVY